MSRLLPAPVRVVCAVGMFGFAVALGLFLARPVHTASIAYDSQVAVLDFDRLVSGRQVEQFLSTTPKPLLTFIFGPLRLLTGDWRSLAWATLLAFGLGVAMMAELARRIGGMAAWAFVGVGLAGSGALLFDVGYALAIPWAMLFWAAAGFALGGSRARYGLAGVALMLATLARLETLLVVGLAAAILVAFQFPPVVRACARRGIAPPPRRAWLILLGFLALPIMMIHDAWIYGDPLFWSTVATRYSADTTQRILSPEGILHWLVDHYLGLWPLIPLGVIGMVQIIRKRAWAAFVWLIAMGPGMAAFLTFLAIRHIYVPDRYVAPIDIVAIAAAGIGAAWILETLVTWARARSNPSAAPGRGPALGIVAAAAVIAGLICWPSGILDPGLRRTVDSSLALAANLDEMLPTLKQIVDQTPGAGFSQGPGGGSGTALAAPLIFVPQAYRPRLSVDLDAPLTSLGSTRAWIGPLAGQPTGTQYVAHDRHSDTSAPVWQPYETLTPHTVNGVRIVPVASNPARGWWISQVSDAPN